MKGPEMLMKRVLLVLLFAMPAAAQEKREWEVFVGYSIQRSNVREYFKSTPTIYSFRSLNDNMNGWELAVTENVNRHVGGTLAVGGHYDSPVLLSVTSRQRMHTLLYGPRVYHRISRLTPFGHALFGIALSNVQVTPTGPHLSSHGFAAAGGAGLDVDLAKRISVRVFQVEYLHANALGANQNNYRASAGILFHFPN